MIDLSRLFNCRHWRGKYSNPLKVCIVEIEHFKRDDLSPMCCMVTFIAYGGVGVSPSKIDAEVFLRLFKEDK